MPNNSFLQSTLLKIISGSWVGKLVTPGEFCRLSPVLFSTLQEDTHGRAVIRSAVIITALGTALYGAAFGAWHSPYQALISACKLPVLFFAIVASSTMLNAFLSQAMGYHLSLRQVCGIVLSGMTVTATLLGAWSPITLFFSLQIPGPDATLRGLSTTDPAVASAMHIYQIVLLANTSAIGAAGIIGNIRLYRLLHHMTGNARSAWRLLLTWMTVIGFVGCQLSYLLSPYLGNPVSPPYWFLRHAWKENFYEYVYHSLENILFR